MIGILLDSFTSSSHAPTFPTLPSIPFRSKAFLQLSWQKQIRFLLAPRPYCQIRFRRRWRRVRSSFLRNRIFQQNLRIVSAFLYLLLPYTSGENGCSSFRRISGIWEQALGKSSYFSRTLPYPESEGKGDTRYRGIPDHIAFLSSFLRFPIYGPVKIRQVFHASWKLCREQVPRLE